MTDLVLKERTKMERTESIVIEVSPFHENKKIKEMEMFGWNLHGHQEVSEEGDTYVEPDTSKGSYVITRTTEHYVKLHFVRSLSLPNLNKIKQIEAEYFSLRLPTLPSLIGPTILFGLSVFPGFFFILTVILIVSGNTEGMKTEDKIVGLVMPVLSTLSCIVIGFIWRNSTIKKRKTAMETREQTTKRRHELISQIPL